MNKKSFQKILLTRHPTTHSKRTAPPVCDLPLGILYVAAEARRRGLDVSIYDAVISEKDPPYIELPDGEVHLGNGWDEIREKIASLKPDVIGISNQFTSQFKNAIRMLEVVKNASPSSITVVGGAHASVLPESYFSETNSIDYVISGEGENTLPELIDALNGERGIETVDGLTYRKDGEIVHNKRRELITDLDKMPIPAYELIDLERYFYLNRKGYSGRESYDYPGSERSISMITSRGCPFNCVFCSIHLSMGKKFRPHSIDYILDHIDHVISKYGVRHIHFEDDNMNLNMKRFGGILDGFAKKNFGFTWDTPNGVRADYLDKEILIKCRDTRCTYLRIGVESADQEVSDKIIGKSLDIEAVVNTAMNCKEIGLDVEAFYVIGFPGEKIMQMQKTIDFAIDMEKKYDLFPYSMFTATPLIGTELYRICDEKGYFLKPPSSQSFATATQGDGMIQTEDFTAEDLQRLVRQFWKRHNTLRVIKFFKFAFTNPLNFLRMVRATIASIKERKRRLSSIIKSLIIFRFKKCFIRRIGEGIEA